jgi:chromosome segregation ATPase
MQRELDSRAALLAKAEEQRDQSRESFKQAYASLRVHEGTIAQLRQHLRAAEADTHHMETTKQRREEELEAAYEKIKELQSRIPRKAPPAPF